MGNRTVTVVGQSSPSHPHRPETFAGASFGIVLPAGAGPLYKVTNSDSLGLGEYFTASAPPTRESARRRLALPESNRAEEVRECATTQPVYAVVGNVAGGSANDVQFEIQDSSSLGEVGRRRIPPDAEARLLHVLESVAGFAFVGLAIGYARKRALLGLAIGIIVGIVFGLLFPTDWTELSSMLFGSPTTTFLFALG